ncbi:MAG TPA: molybdopterin cofactor-binding domain-containing protein [Myxococcota bacterium]|nr:molybdopterin cofactor-binding domain-containing protein [Myxococcota bacterium]
MSAAVGWSRREFLKVSAVAGGGLMLGVRLGSAAEPAGPFRPNAWITIGTDGGITLVSHRNEMGQDVHTSLAMLLAEELAVSPQRVSVAEAPPDPVYLNKLMGAQITGGSTSIRDAWLPLRRAGATARTMLVAAAAGRWKVPAAECRAENGTVVHGDKSYAYGELAAEAAGQPVPREVPLKSASDFSVIGTALPRLDAADKARGRTLFGIDVQQPGMVHAALAQCPVLGGKVASFDAGGVQSRPGVRKVVDIGEGVAVIADHYWTARLALADVKITWDEGPAAKLDTAAIYAALEAAKDEAGALIRQAGDPAEVFSRSQPIQLWYQSQMLAHVSLEPPNCLARVSGDGVDVWTSTQFPQGARSIAAQAAGVEAERVRIHPQFIGGGFGRRLDVDFIGQAVAIAKQLPGVPVKTIYSREDDVTHDFYRPPSLHRMRAVLDGGKLSALTLTMISPSITQRAFPGAVKDGKDGFMTEGLVDFTYDIPNLELRTVIREVGIRVGYWRSVSNALNAFAIESFVDELAHTAGRSPVDFRAELLSSQPRQKAVLLRAVKESGFSTEAGPGRAFGIASMQCYETHVALVAEVSGTANKLKLEKLTYAVDPGIAVHPDQIVAQLESGAVSGLINAVRSKVTVKHGRVEQSSYDSFPIPRMAEMPRTEVVLMPSGDPPGGMGEVGVPLVAPALANAVFALTGKRIRSLPLEDGGVKFA